MLFWLLLARFSTSALVIHALLLSVVLYGCERLLKQLMPKSYPHFSGSHLDALDLHLRTVIRAVIISTALCLSHGSYFLIQCSHIKHPFNTLNNQFFSLTPASCNSLYSRYSVSRSFFWSGSSQHSTSLCKYCLMTMSTVKSAIQIKSVDN